MTTPLPVTPESVPGEPSAAQRIARAALNLFNTKGYSSTTVREIVEAAGVTKPVLYYYFGSKEGLYLRLLEAAFKDFHLMLERALARTGTAVERLRALLQDAYRMFVDHTAEVRLMHAIYYGPPQGAPAFDFHQVDFAFDEAVQRILEDGQRAGEIRDRDVRDLCWAIAGAMNIVMELELCHQERAPGSAGLDRILDVLLEGMAMPRSAAHQENPR